MRDNALAVLRILWALRKDIAKVASGGAFVIAGALVDPRIGLAIAGIVLAAYGGWRIR